MVDFEQGLIELTKVSTKLADELALPIILIDGPAASGKTSLAIALRNKLFKELEYAPRLIHMDDLYPGWDGLRSGSLYLTQNILMPLRLGKAASWQIWDWENNQRGGSDPGNGFREFSGNQLIIIEGCGALSRANSELVNFRVWVDADYSSRKERFRARDQGKFDDQWHNWSVQEQEFYVEENSVALADLGITN